MHHDRETRLGPSQQTTIPCSTTLMLSNHGGYFMSIYDFEFTCNLPTVVAKTSGLDYGSGDRFDSQRTLTACGRSNCKEVKDVFGRSGAHVRVGLARKRPLAASGVNARQQV